MASKSSKHHLLDPQQLLKPPFELQVCVACGVPAGWRYDRKKGRPYHFCPHCGIRIFIYNIQALAGMQVLHDMVLRAGPLRIREAVRLRVDKRLREIENRARVRRRKASDQQKP